MDRNFCGWAHGSKAGPRPGMVLCTVPRPGRRPMVLTFGAALPGRSESMDVADGGRYLGTVTSGA